MCTIKITYDKNNKQAREMLATMLDSGLFYVNESPEQERNIPIDYSDPWLYEDHGDLPPLPEGKEYFTPEEVRDMLMEDLQEIYKLDHELSVPC